MTAVEPDHEPGYRDIVVGTDFSAKARTAYAEACYIATVTRSRLSVLHVVQGGLEPERSSVEQPARPVSGKSRVIERMVAAHGRDSSMGAEAVVREGHQADEIVCSAAERGAGLIVIGAGESSRLHRLFGGESTADKVLRTSPIPVLVVPEAA
jgi:nucleotide-binding universal stress UspA family protein